MLVLRHMSHQQATLNDQNKALADSERKVAKVSVENKTEDTLRVRHGARSNNQTGIEGAIAGA